LQIYNKFLIFYWDVFLNYYLLFPVYSINKGYPIRRLFWACLFGGRSPPAGGSGFSFQTFFAEKAQKGFPLQPLTHIDLRPDSYRDLDLRFTIFKIA